MKTVNYDMAVGNGEVRYGSIQVDDDATPREIDAAVFDDATSSGLLSYNWEVVE